MLEKLNLKLERFVMLLWNFAERGKTYEQISTAANLPTQAHYVDDELSQSCKKHFNSTDTYLDYCTGANSTVAYCTGTDSSGADSNGADIIGALLHYC